MDSLDNDTKNNTSMVLICINMPAGYIQSRGSKTISTEELFTETTFLQCLVLLFFPMQDLVQQCCV